MRRLWRLLAAALLLFVAFVYINNTSLLAERSSSPPTVLAHRGIAQQFDTTNLRNDTCTASRMIAADAQLPGENHSLHAGQLRGRG